MNSSENKSRPILLTWLCLGSASFGVSRIIMFLVLIFFSLSGNVPAQLFPDVAIEYLQAGYILISAEILLTAIGLAGVIMMWQSRQSGFYLYAFIKAIIYFLPVIYIGWNHLMFPGLVLTSILIIFYGTIFTGVRPKKNTISEN
jgi:hypothetical protein